MNEINTPPTYSCFNVQHQVNVHFRHHRVRTPAPPCSRRTSNTMNVISRIGWHVIVDDRLNDRNIQPTKVDGAEVTAEIGTYRLPTSVMINIGTRPVLKRESEAILFCWVMWEWREVALNPSSRRLTRNNSQVLR